MRDLRTKHGMRGAPEYKVWSGIKARCMVPASALYRWYGGRGITACPEWRDSFQAFYRDVGKRPTPKHTIERIDNDGNYEPGNVRWATRTEQARNRRTSVLIELNGETRCLTDWARAFGLGKTTVRRRIESGWPKENWFIPARPKSGTERRAAS